MNTRETVLSIKVVDNFQCWGVWKCNRDTFFKVTVTVCRDLKWGGSWLFVTPWTVAHQAPLSMEFSRQEYCSGLPFSPPGESFQPKKQIHISYASSLTSGFLTTSAIWEAHTKGSHCDFLGSLSFVAAAESLQSCPTLCDPIDDSPPDFPVPGILQARTLEWVAISFSNAWKWKVKVSKSYY